MKINKKKVIPTLALIGLTLGATGVTAAEVARSNMDAKPALHTPARHEHKHMFRNLTLEQKQVLEKVHQLNQEGKRKEAMSLIKSSGILLPEIKDPEQHKERKRQFDIMIDSNDYEAFEQMVANTPMADIVDTQEKFDALVESHELREEGRYEEAREVLEGAEITLLGKMMRMHR
jgi:hypothetical protein